MAGMIGAQDNGAGIKGINPDAEIYSIQILDENNQSTLGQVIAGIHGLAAGSLHDFNLESAVACFHRKALLGIGNQNGAGSFIARIIKRFRLEHLVGAGVCAGPGRHAAHKAAQFLQV